MLALKETSSRTELDDLTLARIKRGDRAAFGDLVRFYQRPVFALLSRMLLGTTQRDLVEDLAQETFVRAFSAIETFGSDGRTHLSAWLLTIATRLAIDALRKRAPTVLYDDDELARLPSCSRADETLFRRNLSRAIEAAVERLPPDYRAAFLLREVHDFDYEAIAEALAVDIGTVKSRLSRARAALRAALAEVYP